MTVWRQAWCYVARKREKTVVVAAILVTIMVLLSAVLTMRHEESSSRLEAGQGVQRFSTQVDMTQVETVKAVEEASSTMQSLLQIMVLVLVVMSVVVVSCLLFFRIRERKYEIGILISIGRGKGRIVAQLAVEMLYLMGMALLPALIVSVGLLKLLGYGIHPICFLEAIGIWLGTVLVSLVVSALGIMTKNAKTILTQID
ncbi:ABC transporter permease [Bifidobacterium eulemuris]|uniref:ABC transporter permease n=1 Tax=Bifidobacterium eulemuris TaxID=1765219 RepID=A0A261GD44_9BIFI|nr:FtsX-like permease family protein [Bifidobacterium eulemuris]OZG69055.1 ABC transporter permease [Bifidobacterium eulemuris]QOL31419.1 FtsX-like permease family protein [Bifidobacterium eulemuris]